MHKFKGVGHDFERLGARFRTENQRFMGKEAHKPCGSSLP